MLNTPEHPARNMQPVSTLLNERVVVLRRVLLISISIVVIGIITLAIWDLPVLMLFLSSPTVFVIFLFLFALVIWWIGANYGWWDHIRVEKKQVNDLSPDVQKQQAPLKRREQTSTLVTTGRLSASRFYHMRHTSAVALQMKRKKRLYAGREY